ncbi:MAG: putative spermidine/putrescine transport system ATP-binding protein [Thermoleophilaceae bacterium]|jgi:putative spermidine/putrescine transport system ATP-binding protein|nr:putative spermidine/putrescine transport system ATP-binding protein [Thermoleophilaceae bacterium]
MTRVTEMTDTAPRPAASEGSTAPALPQTPVSEGALRLEAITKRFGDVTAVDSVDVSLEPGEFLTLLGPSGSGKTTTLLLIAGFERPTAGEIYLDARRITETPAHQRDMGMVFQNYALFPHMTVFDNIAFPLRMRGASRAELRTRTAESLALVRLEGYEARYPRELSGGQQQRIALARASVYRPPLMLMDEPLSALDRKLRGEMQVEIRRLHRDLGTSMISVTHDQEEALALSDRIVLMNEGQIEQVGSAREIYERPQTLFAARFLGESNVLSGELMQPGSDGTAEVLLSTGQRMRGRINWSASKGDPVVVMTRPERGSVAAVASNPDPASNLIEFKLDEAVYLGDRLRCHGTFASGDAGVLLLDVREAQDLLGTGRGWVSWPVDDTVVLPTVNGREVSA